MASIGQTAASALTAGAFATHAGGGGDRAVPMMDIKEEEAEPSTDAASEGDAQALEQATSQQKRKSPEDTAAMLFEKMADKKKNGKKSKKQDKEMAEKNKDGDKSKAGRSPKIQRFALI